MKFPWILIVAMACHSTMAVYGAAPRKLDADTWTSATESIIHQRLEQLRLPFPVKQTQKVMVYIRDYTVVGVNETEAMLGRAALLMPVFEHYLSIYQLPQELKYLPIVESGLKADTRSPAGARGLWQLMEVTARQYKLRVTGGTDERLDPYKSTDAAMRILSDLYEQYQDWPLAIAAYNCGPGRVNKAIRLAGKKDYWTVSRYLPAETQRYVPAFVAAAYIHKHYKDHNLTPQLSEAGKNGVRVFRISTSMNFSAIAKASGTSVSVIRQLNPAFPGAIPASSTGYYLTLPAGASPAFRLWLNQLPAYDHSAFATKGFYHTTYVVASGDLIETIARGFQCSVADIMRWNNLKVQEVVVNQELNIYLSKDFLLRKV